MRSFFLQIILSFWISIFLTYELTAVIFPHQNHWTPEGLELAMATSLEEMAQAEIANCAAITSGSFLVLDENSRDICGKSVPAAASEVARVARDKMRPSFLMTKSRSFSAQPVAYMGRTFVAALYTSLPGPTWYPHLPPWTLPVSAAVTFVLAYLLTNPVRALRIAFRRFASGDMKVRLPVSRTALRDWGGADIRTLMIDFNEMADRIQALVEAHKTLLRDVSHELRSPLARLNVALELAREEAPEANLSLDRAELESSRLNSLIGQLLSLSSMEALQQAPKRGLIRLSDLVEQIMPDLTFEAGARDCEVAHENHNSCPVSGNADLLRRALENVIRNAVRYSPAHGRITVETMQAARQSVVRVSDSGPGVPEESLTAIFRPFYRVDSARQNSTGGFGVGLAIADRAIQLHGGTIHAFNRHDGGLCVELALPCAEE